jgi:large subunit ribosomal protein L21
MYAIIQTGGKQYRVAPGDTIQVETIAGDVGSEVELQGILAVSTDDGGLLAGDDVAGAKVKATITAQGRGDKIKVFKFKRKKQYKRTIGHRQDYTSLRVDEVLA